MISLLESKRKKGSDFFFFSFPGVEPFIPGPGWSLPGGKLQKDSSKINSGGKTLVGGQFFDGPKCHQVAKVDKMSCFYFLCNIVEIKAIIYFSNSWSKLLRTSKIWYFGGYYIENPSVSCYSEFMSFPCWKYSVRRSRDVSFNPGG